jgi:general secretion pathway protein D
MNNLNICSRRFTHTSVTNPLFKLTAMTLACLTVASCAVQAPAIPSALDFERTADRQTAVRPPQTAVKPVDTSTQIRRTPVPPTPFEGNVRPGPTAKLSDVASSQPGDISVAVEQMTLPAFIQAVYGGILQLNYSMEPTVSSRTELITFRSPKPMSSKQLMEASENLLKSYGVNVQDLGGVIRLSTSANTANISPMVRRGRAQPTVPGTLRPIFHYVEPEVQSASILINSIRPVLGDRVTLQSSGTGILLSGTADNVTTAMELIQVFDQPSLRAYQTTRVVPRFWSADELSRRLSDVLRAEGYSVGNQALSLEPIVIYSIPPANSVMIFGVSQEVVDHVLEWVVDLDQPPSVQAGSSFFTYSVRHSDAVQLAKSLTELIGTAGASNPGQTTGQAVSRSRKVVANVATNSLIFQGGSQEDYREWLALLNELDKPVKSAMIDVLVAEVALDDSTDLGFNWKLDQLGSGARSVRLQGTTYSTQVSGAGLTINALLGGNSLRQLAISALASNSRSRIVSNPRLMTRNGESASINVGQEVPTVSSQTVTTSSVGNTTTSSTTPVSVQYRSTGVLLRVRPVIHGSDRIDIEVSQEISSAEPTTTGVSSSPTFRKRSLDTKLTVRDGATILLGGLISENTSDSDSGVPGLKDVPGLGSLFKNQERSRGRTELVMMITTYIINDNNEADNATEAYSASLGDWAKDLKERIKARREINQKRSPVITEPTSAAPAALPLGSAPENEKSPQRPIAVQPVIPPRPAVTNTRPAASKGMVQIGNDAPRPSDAAIPSGAAPASASPAGPVATKPNPGIPPTPAVQGKPAPASINGFNTPAGATVVDDPKLIEELMRSIKR